MAYRCCNCLLQLLLLGRIIPYCASQSSLVDLPERTIVCSWEYHNHVKSKKNAAEAILVVVLAAVFIIGVISAKIIDTVNIPDVVSESLADALDELENAGIDEEDVTVKASNFDYDTAMEFVGNNSSSYSNSIDDTNFDIFDSQWGREAKIVEENPKPGRYDKNKYINVTITVRLSKRGLRQYNKAVAAMRDQDAAREKQYQQEMADQQALETRFNSLKGKIEAGQCVSVSGCMPDVEALGAQVEYVSESDVTSSVALSPDEWRFKDDTSSDSINFNIPLVTLSVEQIPYPELYPDASESSSDRESSPNPGSSESYSDTGSSGGGSNRWQYYKNCKQVWNALGHGITSSDPGYSRDLDADGDGRACEVKPNY